MKIIMSHLGNLSVKCAKLVHFAGYNQYEIVFTIQVQNIKVGNYFSFL